MDSVKFFDMGAASELTKGQGSDALEDISEPVQQQQPE